MDYYLAMKRNKVLIPSTTRTNLENMCYVKEASCKRSHIIHLYETFGRDKFVETESRLWLPGARGRDC